MAVAPRSSPPPSPRKGASAPPRRRVKAPTTLPPEPHSARQRVTTLWPEVARLVILLVCALLLVLIVRGGNQVYQVAFTTFGWLAYLAPVVACVIGFDLLRRRSGDLPLLRFEETNGIILLFVALDVALAGLGLPGGYVGTTVANGLLSLGGRAAVALGVAGLIALGGVLTFHLTTQQVGHAGLLGARGVGRGGRRGAGLLWRTLRFVARALWRGVRALAARRSARATAHRAAVAAAMPQAVAPPGRNIVRLAPAGSAPTAPPVASGPAAAPTSGSTSAVAAVSQQHEVAAAPARPLAAVRAALGRVAPAAPAPAPTPLRLVKQDDEDESEHEPTPARPAAVRPAATVGPQWPRPALDLLDPVVVAAAGPVDNEYRKQVIEDTLLSFNVKATVVDAHTGPTVTQFDLQPDRGVRVQRVTALANDLALALAAPGSIRIEAPVPGRPVIGLQVPNPTTYDGLAARDPGVGHLSRGALAAEHRPGQGRGSGEPVVADLTKMPHLLIAGATGSGKSVCLNSLIACLLFHNSPDTLRLLMIDPKMVELTPFNGVPHLLAPVVTDVEKVPNTLKWALREMKDRYTKFTAAGVRNVLRYNEIQAHEGDRLPYIVIIIDELADLMMVAPEEVEDHICRLAQLARATGIHLVIATQRPSVDVITGLIKANFPSRIAFAVSSQVDSRTIMDVAGAEKLMGRGDMLYMASDGTKPLRVQGAHLSEKEIETLVAFWKYNAPAAPSQIPAEELDTPQADPDESAAEEKMIEDATKVVREYNRASVSLLQRRLSIGYSRAARLLDQLEERGVVGPSHDGRSRMVILSPTEVQSRGVALTAGAPPAPADEDDEPPF